jgi:hypothetical protein
MAHHKKKHKGTSGGSGGGTSGWTFQFGNNTPSHPNLLTGGVWWFDLVSGMEVDYLTMGAGSVPQAASVTITIALDVATGALISATGGGNPGITFYMQRKGDDLSGSGKFADYRLWANTHRLALGGHAGTYTVTIPMSKAMFTNVNGQQPSSSGWDGMLANMDKVGVTFGATFFGHGWQSHGGTVRVSMTQFDLA